MLKSIHYNWLRYLVTATAFSMALVLTPRVFVDEGHSASTIEVPVRVLEQPDNCLWCTPQPPPRCDDLSEEPRLWLNPDTISPEELVAPCEPVVTGTGPTA